MPDRDQRFTQEPTQQELTAPAVAEPAQPNVATPLPQHPEEHKGRLHLFSEYCEYPDHVTFHDQEPDEVILLFLRKSLFVNLHWMIASVILAVLPIGLLFLPNNDLPFPIPSGLTTILVLMYYLLLITYAFVNFIIWYYNAALITTHRVIDIDFHQLIYKDIAETKMNLVQDVSYRQQSVAESLFDFGHILIQTAGTIDNFEFDALPHPERVEEMVNNLIGKGRTYVS